MGEINRPGLLIVFLLLLTITLTVFASNKFGDSPYAYNKRQQTQRKIVLTDLAPPAASTPVSKKGVSLSEVVVIGGLILVAIIIVIAILIRYLSNHYEIIVRPKRWDVN